MINRKDRTFLDKRKKLQRYWPIMGTIMIVMLLGLVIYLYIKSPKLINPFLVVDLIKTNSMSPSTMALMTAMCPVLSIFLLFTVAVVITYVWAFMILEARYHKIIEDLEPSENKENGKQKVETEKKEEAHNESKEEKS